MGKERHLRINAGTFRRVNRRVGRVWGALELPALPCPATLSPNLYLDNTRLSHPLQLYSHHNNHHCRRHHLIKLHNVQP